MSDLLKVSSNPHVRDKNSTQTIMGDVLIALIPATIFGIYNFGLRAALLILVTVATAVISEFIYQKLMKLPNTVCDLSAAVTGLLLALNLPYNLPYWMAILGSIFAIIIVKQLFGGIGQNFMNPALAARCFLLLSFGTKMTVFTYDAITGPTPLKVIRDTGSFDLYHMFLGITSGTIGETSAIAILIGAAYLLGKKIIDIKIPLTYIGTFSIFILFFGQSNFDLYYLACQICGGGLLLGAFFMATDYVTSPITSQGKIIFGICLGLLTGMFRVFGPNAEGVSFAIIFCNLLVPLIEKITIPRPFGKERKKEAKHE